jgi:pimeloyl-ACP methyl ester carboxylesterase
LALLFSLGSHAEPVSPAAHVTAAIRQMDHISVETVGQGSPVILIPGMSMSRENWRSTSDRLASSHRVYLVQINGFGGSAPGKNLEPGVLDGVVADLHALIVQEHLGKPAVVGHSLGGTIALMFGKAHPDEAGRLLIVDALPWIGLLMGPTLTVPQIEPQAQAMRKAIAASFGKPVDEKAARAQIAILALKPSSQDLAYRWSRDADNRVVAQVVYEDMTTDLRPELPALSMPVTLIYPWASAGPAKEAADALYHSAYANVPHITFVDIGNSGHFIMLDQPDAFNAAIDHFLDD